MDKITLKNINGETFDIEMDVKKNIIETIRKFIIENKLIESGNEILLYHNGKELKQDTKLINGDTVIFIQNKTIIPLPSSDAKTRQVFNSPYSSISQLFNNLFAEPTNFTNPTDSEELENITEESNDTTETKTEEKRVSLDSFQDIIGSILNSNRQDNVSRNTNNFPNIVLDLVHRRIAENPSLVLPIIENTPEAKQWQTENKYSLISDQNFFSFLRSSEQKIELKQRMTEQNNQEIDRIMEITGQSREAVLPIYNSSGRNVDMTLSLIFGF